MDKSYSKELQPAEQEPASTLPGALFRENSFDQDAEDTQVRMSNFGDAEGEQDEDLDVPDNEPPAFRSLEEELEPAGDSLDEEETVTPA